MNNCIICGSPCKNKYCKSCATEAYKLKRKEREQNQRKGIFVQTFKGCTEDCFNCPYLDCKKPIGTFRSDNTVTINKSKGSISQSKMYTLELGGYGGARPNISRKFYV